MFYVRQSYQEYKNLYGDPLVTRSMYTGIKSDNLSLNFIPL